MLPPAHATCRVFSLTAPRESAFMLLIGPDYGQFRPVPHKPCHETYVILRALDRDRALFFFRFPAERDKTQRTCRCERNPRKVCLECPSETWIFIFYSNEFHE